MRVLTISVYVPDFLCRQQVFCSLERGLNGPLPRLHAHQWFEEYPGACKIAAAYFISTNKTWAAGANEATGEPMCSPPQTTASSAPRCSNSAAAAQARAGLRFLSNAGSAAREKTAARRRRQPPCLPLGNPGDTERTDLRTPSTSRTRMATAGARLA